MTVVKEFEIENVSDLLDVCWSGAIDRIRLFDDNDLGDELVEYLNEVFFTDVEDGNPITTTALNDFIWFDLPETDFYESYFDKNDNLISKED